MGKPSIFSREYEKRMKRRRRNIIVISLVILLVMFSISVKFITNPIDYANIKENIQAWIDSDDVNSANQTQAKEEINNKNTKEEVNDEPQKAAEESMDIQLVSGNVAKAIYINDESNGKTFKSLNNADSGVSFDISVSGKQMLVADTNSVITLYNVDGSSKVISKEQYVSTKGSVFTKEATMQAQPEYLWNANPKFISEDKIIFISNRPYFGTSAENKYLWITDIQTGEDKTLWDLSGRDIEIGEKEEKGIKVTIDGKIYYIDADGNYIQ
ncbi:hypothetical protein [Clostridium sp. BL-8]|uniref:hypothetical protein n=1 Tax=Clostridium sp. BL-8 TaxID=349938 RepID=UPI00098C1BBA|nr:hypothetical protein [Clostridium sp. BL-8]OOM76742.1 hypothetical protein CLOBL_33360 [Clostridium sp. BL-8]